MFDSRDPQGFFTIPVDCFLCGDCQQVLTSQQVFVWCLMLRAVLCFHQCPFPTGLQFAFLTLHLAVDDAGDSGRVQSDFLSNLVLLVLVLVLLL